VEENLSGRSVPVEKNPALLWQIFGELSARWSFRRGRQDCLAGEAARSPTVCSKGTNAMTKELEVNDNTAQDQERQPQQRSGGKRNPQKLQGKALQVNENSVGAR
jgi:hypothetical protein